MSEKTRNHVGKNSEFDQDLLGDGTCGGSDPFLYKSNWIPGTVKQAHPFLSEYGQNTRSPIGIGGGVKSTDSLEKPFRYSFGELSESLWNS